VIQERTGAFQGTVKGNTTKEEISYLALSVARVHTTCGPTFIYVPEIAIQFIQNNSHTTRVHKSLCTTLPACFNNIPCSLDVDLEDGVFAPHGVSLRA
jgi:hypothetical protein